MADNPHIIIQEALRVGTCPPLFSGNRDFESGRTEYRKESVVYLSRVLPAADDNNLLRKQLSMAAPVGACCSLCILCRICIGQLLVSHASPVGLKERKTTVLTNSQEPPNTDR
jgi:hypothetical protein